MTALGNLKLVAAKRTTQLSPALQRRNKVIKQLHEQIQLAAARLEGKAYAPTKLRTVKDAATGESKTVAVPKRIKEWWFTTNGGALCVQLRYGAKVVELAKGKTAVEIANMADLVPTLEVLKSVVEGGELDTQLESLSGSVKAGFKK